MKEVKVIFRDFLNKAAAAEVLSANGPIGRVISFVKKNKLIVRAGSLCLAGMLGIGISIVATGITLGFKVRYGGSDIATVRSASVFESARGIILKTVDADTAEAIKQPDFKMTLTVSDRLSSAYALASAILENTGDIVEAAALNVNGEQLICGQADELNAALEAGRTRFEPEGAESTSEFTDEISVEKGYYLKSELASSEELKTAACTLNVKTVSVIVTDTDIPYTTKTVKTGTELIGYSCVTQKGETGLNRKTESVESINGEVTSRTELSAETLKNPVQQVVLVGTAKTTATAAERTAARSEGFICPLTRGSFVITSYYGDGRGHKGMDLAADSGTPIYAVADGTVTASGFQKAYGYYVDVDHGNGITTRYAHASVLKVARGATVKQGDLLALVGRTGNSTGNHLHFEVIVNGNRVNPASYIGLD